MGHLDEGQRHDQKQSKPLSWACSVVTMRPTAKLRQDIDAWAAVYRNTYRAWTVQRPSGVSFSSVCKCLVFGSSTQRTRPRSRQRPPPAEVLQGGGLCEAVV